MTSTGRFDVDFYTNEHLDDPFPLYEEIRTAGRVVWNDAINSWMVPNFEENARVLFDGGENFGTTLGDPSVIFWFEALNMMMVDGGEHARLRNFLAPLFTRSAIARWETRVRDVVDDLLRPLVERPEGFDLIADFSMIPTIIVADLLGVPDSRYDDFRRWSHSITSNLSHGHESEAQRVVMRATATELNSYMKEEVARHRRDRPDDLITAMLDSPMTDAEIVSTSVLLLLAGYDTTAKVMANCVVALQLHPDQRRLVADDPSLIPAAIEEVLRWWGLLQLSPRRVKRDTVLAGTQLRLGDKVYTMPAAGSRDPQRWDRPAHFDVRRELKSNLGFGHGPHLCLGAPLARLETRVALERLLSLAPEYHVSDYDFGKSFTNRGPDRGTVQLEPPEPAASG